MTLKNLLILKASDDVQLCETGLVRGLAEMYEINVDEIEVKAGEDLAGIEASGTYDIVYACGHGDRNGLGDREPGGRFVAWDDVALALCDVLSDESWFFLACCRGGLEQVVYQMFCTCPSMSYVFGPRWNSDAHQLACAFHVLVHNFTHQGVEPLRAAGRASEAIDLTIRAFDRGEVEASDAFWQWCDLHGYADSDSAYSEV